MAWLRAFFLPEGSRVRRAPFAIVTTAGLLGGLGLGFLDPAQRLDWMLYDRFVRIMTRAAEPPGDIVVVAIDELSFGEIGVPWPWPRRLHAELTERLTQAGARTIVFDLLFDVPAADPEDDRLFGQAIDGAGNVVLGADRAELTDRAYEVVQWTDPIPPLAAGAAAVGAVRIGYDPDGVLRRAALRLDGRPGLALAAALRERGFGLPDNPDEPRLIRFNGPPRQGIRTVSYYQALDPEGSLPPDIFRDKIVLVGMSLAAASTLEETADHFTTPAAVRMSGVEIHANLLDTLLRGKAIEDPFASPSTVLALSLVLAGFTALLLYLLAPTTGLGWVVAVGVIWLVGSYGLLARLGMRVPIVAPLMTIAGTYAGATAYRYALVSRERRFIRRAFEHYVAPAIVEKMLADPAKLALGGEEYDVTVMFTDLEGFTTLAEGLTPRDLQRHLSGHFTEMLRLLLTERATLDKLIGDGIMAYFGCPIRDPAHAHEACRAALAMQRRMLELNQEWQAKGTPGLRMRVGINTGPVVAGNMGTSGIFNYTIFGDCVNLASRLEGVNKEYGSLTLIGEETWRHVKGSFEVRELDYIRVKGKLQPVAIYELAAESGRLSAARQELFARFAAGLARYRAGEWNLAASEFRSALAILPTDGPSLTFLKRCEAYALQPPPADWAGVHVMRTK